VMTLMFGYCRVTSLACNIKDGSVVKMTKKGEKPDLKNREVAFAVEEIPSVFDYLSYMYFCGAPISGPWIEYKDLIQFFKFEGHYKNVQETHTVGKALLRFVQAWLCVGAGAFLSQYFSLPFLISKDFAESGFLYQMFHLYGSLKLEMQTFLVGFCLMETGPVMCGLSYNGVDEVSKIEKHDRV
jgi:hypothetical protein